MPIIKVYVPVPGVGGPGTSKEPAQPKPRSTITVLEDILLHPATKIKVNKAHFIRPSFGLSTILTPRKRAGDHNFNKRVTLKADSKKMRRAELNLGALQVIAPIKEPRLEEQVTVGDSLTTSASGIPFSFDEMMKLLEHEPEYAHSLLPHVTHFV